METVGVAGSTDHLLVEGAVGGNRASPVLRTLYVHPVRDRLAKTNRNDNRKKRIIETEANQSMPMVAL
jgi:hypothetical protein